MTNERAIELLKRISDSQFDGPHGDERREALEMAVRALEQNLVKESGGLVKDLVKDCISRQQAIDAFEPEHDTDWYTPQIIEVLEALPPVQPTQTNADSTQSNTLDCVSRRAAMIVIENSGLDDDSKDTVVRVLEQLPSAQPETHDKRTETHECDLIDRQAVINAINTWDKFGVDERCRIVRWYEGLEPYVHLRDVLTAIVNLPAAQPQWIPFSKMMPAFGESVLVQFDDDDMDILTFPNIYKRLKRVAWMPLPEPYGGENE